MNNYKRIIIALIVSVFCTTLVIILYQNIEKRNISSIYIIKNEVKKGDLITDENTEKIQIIGPSNKYINELDSQYYAIYDMQKGKALEEENISISKPDNSENIYEYVGIEIENVSDAVGYQVKPNDKVNLYFTAKNGAVNNAIEKVEVKYSSELEDGMTTYKILEKNSVDGVYDSNGNSVDSIGGPFNTIVFRVKSQEALVINCIKKLGKFSLTKI